MPMADVTWDFTGKVALASGGASGIGRAAATAWLAAGARIAILDQSAERLEETTGALGADRLLAIPGDVSEPADCDRAIDETVRRFGRLDVVLNAAGIGGIGRVWELDPLIWDRVLAVNLRGTFLLTRDALDGGARAARARHQHRVDKRDRADHGALPVLCVEGGRRRADAGRCAR